MTIKELESKGFKRLNRKLSTTDKYFGSRLMIKEDKLIYVFGNKRSKKCLVYLDSKLVTDFTSLFNSLK